MVIVVKMKKVVERLYNAFEDIRYNLDSEVTWFNETSLQVENCFEYLRKRAMFTKDHLGFFGWFWPNIDPKMEHWEYIQRVTILIWSNFVFSLSSVEFFLKNIIKESSKGPLVEWLKEKKEEAAKDEKPFWMYLNNIMKESRKKKLITKSQLKSWTGMILLRNAIIHNNGVFEKDRELNIDGVKITTQAGKSIETQLVNYPRFFTTLVVLTKSWIGNYLKTH